MKCTEQANAQNQKVDMGLLRARGGGGEWGGTLNRYGVSFGGDESILKLDHGGGCTTL